MFGNLKLQTKMLITYAIVCGIVSISLLLGIIGLFSNSRSFNEFADLSDTSRLVNKVQNNLLLSRISYEHFLTNNDSALSVEFDYNYNEMISGINEIMSKDVDNEIKSHVEEISNNLIDYKNSFSEIQILSNDMNDYYNSITAKGNIMLDTLNQINESAYLNGNYALNELTSNATIHLLSARLHSSKYFDFHDKSNYDEYIKYYQLYIIDVQKMHEAESIKDYEHSFTKILNNVYEYNDEMLRLNSAIIRIDELILEMKDVGPNVTQHAEEIINIVLASQKSQISNTTNYNNRKSIQVIVVALIAVAVLIVSGLSIVRFILAPIISLTTTFEEISKGDGGANFRLPLKGKDEIGLMSIAFNRFMDKLSIMLENIKLQNRLKTGQNTLLDLTRDKTNLTNISETILNFLMENTDGILSKMYIEKDDSNAFECTAKYGTAKTDDLELINTGEGIIGQSILDKRINILSNIEDNYLKVVTSLGAMNPRHILILPCMVEDNVNSIIEIGSINPFSDTDIELFEGFSKVIGTIVNSTKLHIRMKELLDKTIHQSEELQMQQEELRQSNEELEEQTQALKQSQQILQNQKEELRVSNEELEERSKQLENQKFDLNEKNKAILASQQEILEKAHALEQANRYKSEFLANMSHELRTPLNSILVLSQLLATRDNSKLFSEKEREFANTINSSGSDLLALINSVLDLAKVESGKTELLIEEVRLRNIVLECERLFQPVAEEKNIRFKSHIEKGIVEKIESDKLRLSQIIKNLISNAIKFTHEGYVELTVRRPLENECDKTKLNKDNAVAIAVKDTGIGIDPDKKDVIFEAFRQMDGTTSRNYGGTGLGLTISLELAILLGGNILVESKVGSGSTFVLILPTEFNNISPSIEGEISKLEHTQKDESFEKVNITAQNDDLGIENKTTVNNEQKKLLIIEDDETFAKILSDLAKEKGYSSILSNNGQNGLSLAKEVKPDAIILDIGLPDMDGMEVANYLEKDSITRNIPIHVISGRENINKDQLPKSIIGILKKPVDIKSIYQTLAKIESLNQKGLKKLLVVGQCGGENFKHFANLGNVEVAKVLTGQEGLNAIKNSVYGCIVLDTKLDDMNGLEFMTKLKEVQEIKVPIIIYTEEAIDLDEYDSINQYAETIILKSEKSQERLRDEVALFLHDMEKNIEKYTNVKANVKQKIEENKNHLYGKSVLLVDDDERNVFALLHGLQQYGLEVIVAKNGFNAIEKFENEKQIDIILMDIMMPKMDGYEAIRRIRKNEKGEKLPIIALTAKAMLDDRNKCIEAGADDYMTKPIDLEKLISLIRVWLA